MSPECYASAMTSRETQWQPAYDGSTLGTQGAQGGTIVRDEALAEQCRLTLEQDETRDFYAVTCGITGWFLHTRFFGVAAEASAAFEEMKPALAELASRLPPEGARTPEAARRGGPLLAAFMGRFP